MNEILVWLLVWGRGYKKKFNTPTLDEKPSETLVNNCATANRSCVFYVKAQATKGQTIAAFSHRNVRSEPEKVQIFADLDGQKVNGGTIPPHIMVTSSRCDLVVIDSSTTPATV